ncbi:hypothetical protein PT110_09650, partial [Erysipelothrix rhusiopathiae]|nr:hypothetical protein [Erysipelothrix rhusiopathiae]
MLLKVSLVFHNSKIAAVNAAVTAIVGEAGPELLRHENGRTSVVPLTRSGGSNQTPLIDYDKLAR